MLIRLKRIDRKEDESIMFNFPYEESEISNVYNQLELETSTAPNCYIEEVVYDSDIMYKIYETLAVAGVLPLL